MSVLTIDQGTIVRLNGAWFLVVKPKDGGHCLYKYLAQELADAVEAAAELDVEG